MTDINSHSKRILRLPDVVARVRLCRASIYQRMADGSFPRSIPIGARARGWLEGDILRGGAKVYRRSGGIVRLRRCESVPRERVSFSLYEHRPKGGKDVQRGDLSTHTACLSR